jgi:drug/metabolite transporter (DMT)-like permease
VFNSERRRGWTAAALTIVLWASAFAGIRVALKSFGVGELSLLRLTIASLTLLAVAPFVGLRLPTGRDLVALAAAALTGMAGYQLLLNTGEQTVNAGTASILVNTGPIFVALLAIRFVGERLTRQASGGIAVAFLGALIIALGEGRGLSVSSGALLVLGAAVSQATFFVVQKPLLSRYSPFEVTTYAMLTGTVMLLPFAPSVPRAIADASSEALAATAFLGVGASAFGFFAWAYANARLEVSRAASSLYLVPPVAIFVAWLWLGEVPTLTTVIGGVVAISGVLLANNARRRSRRTNGRAPGESLEASGTDRRRHSSSPPISFPPQLETSPSRDRTGRPTARRADRCALLPGRALGLTGKNR